MLRLCGKGHIICCYDDWDPLEKQNRDCPACEKEKRIEDLQDEMKNVLDELKKAQDYIAWTGGMP